MAEMPLTVLNEPKMPGAAMLLALTGWMDGGLVSTGTVKHLMEGRELIEVARVEPAGFYIDNFPGSMEITALFRPHVKYSGGLVESFDMPSKQFHPHPAGNNALFVGKEPNLKLAGVCGWLFDVVAPLRVGRVI